MTFAASQSGRPLHRFELLMRSDYIHSFIFDERVNTRLNRRPHDALWLLRQEDATPRDFPPIDVFFFFLTVKRKSSGGGGGSGDVMQLFPAQAITILG